MTYYLDIMNSQFWIDTLRTPGLSLERPVQPSPLPVPAAVELAADRLLYRWRGSDAAEEQRWAVPSRGMLEDFIGLADGPDARILAFAGRWGPLQICAEHGIPLSHAEGFRYWPCLAPTVEGQPEWRWEPLTAWRRYAGVARGCLEVAAKLRNEEMGNALDWERIDALLKPGVPERSNLGPINSPFPERVMAPEEARDPNWVVKRQRNALTRRAMYWLAELAHVGLRLSWDERIGGPAIKLAGERSDLFGALGLQLLFAMSGSGGFVTCSGCGAPYAPRRQPIAGRRHYCQDCGRTTAIRDAQTRFRAEHPDYYKSRKRTSESGGSVA